jgi:hypothetical protein
MTRHRANPLMLLPGLLLIVIGTLAMIGGLAWAALAVVGVEAPQPGDLGSGPDSAGELKPLVDGFAVFVIGCTVMTVGRYLWRGARRRGWRDRLGRLLIIAGYLDIGAALVVLTRFILEALGDTSDGTGTIVHGLITVLVIAVPGVLLALPGLRLAREEPLMNADVRAGL